jgi:hypothetical protein
MVTLRRFLAVWSDKKALIIHASSQLAAFLLAQQLLIPPGVRLLQVEEINDGSLPRA